MDADEKNPFVEFVADLFDADKGALGRLDLDMGRTDDFRNRIEEYDRLEAVCRRTDFNATVHQMVSRCMSLRDRSVDMLRRFEHSPVQCDEFDSLLSAVAEFDGAMDAIKTRRNVKDG